MAEYTRKDIICFTDDPRLENAIGKKVYGADSPSSLLSLASGDMWPPETLARIHKDVDFRPFSTYFEGPWFTGYNHYDVIIIKKEEPKPKYIPFENVTEFLDAYRNAPGCLNEEACYLSKKGIWLKGKASKAYYMVTKIWDIGVLLVDDSDEITWEELLEYYTFLDGSPCGKELKE